MFIYSRISSKKQKKNMDDIKHSYNRLNNIININNKIIKTIN